MNLRQVNTSKPPNADASETNPSLFSTLSFRLPSSIIGNIGEDLDFGDIDEHADSIEFRDSDSDGDHSSEGSFGRSTQ